MFGVINSDFFIQEGHSREVYHIAFHPDGSLAATWLVLAAIHKLNKRGFSKYFTLSNVFRLRENTVAQWLEPVIVLDIRILQVVHILNLHSLS